MLVHNAHLGNRQFPAEKQKGKKGGGGRGLNSHTVTSYTHTNPSIHFPPDTYPLIQPTHPSTPLPVHTHTLTPYTHTHPCTPVHSDTQPQDSIHMHMHRLLVPYIQAISVICFEFMSPEPFLLFSGLWSQAFDFLYFLFAS